MKVEGVLSAAVNKAPYPGRGKESFKISPPLPMIHINSRVPVRVDGVDTKIHQVHIMGHDLWLSVNSYQLDLPLSDLPSD